MSWCVLLLYKTLDTSNVLMKVTADPFCHWVLMTNVFLWQFIREPIPVEDASVGQYLAAGSHRPLSVASFLNPLCWAFAGESSTEAQSVWFLKILHFLTL